MAAPVNISRILDPDEFPDKAVIMQVRGKITKLWPVKKGEGDNGPYEFQNGTLQDNTGEIKICFSNSTQPPSARGKVVTISAVSTKQHGWQGCKVEDREYTDGQGQQVQERSLKVTASAEIDYTGAGSQQTQQQPRQQGGTTQQQGKPATQQANKQQVQQQHANVHPATALAELAALHKAVSTIVNDTYGEAKPEFVATVFIEACKQGLAIDYIARAAKPVKKQYPAPPKDPAQWKQCVIPMGGFEGKTLAELPDDKLKQMHDFYDAKKDNSPFAECVYQAARDRGVLPPPEQVPGDSDGSLDAQPDDIPF